MVVLCVLISILIAYVVFRFQKIDKIPCYTLQNKCLIEKARQIVPNLSVHYKGHGEDLDNISVARVIIWNAGRSPIVCGDIPTTDPLKITGKDNVRILGAEVVADNHAPAACKCEFKKQANVAFPSFEYLERNHGLAIEVFHTGVSPKDLVVTGSIIGGGGIRYIANPRKKLLSVDTFIVGSLLIMAVAAGLVSFKLAFDNDRMHAEWIAKDEAERKDYHAKALSFRQQGDIMSADFYDKVEIELARTIREQDEKRKTPNPVYYVPYLLAIVMAGACLTLILVNYLPLKVPTGLDTEKKTPCSDAPSNSNKQPDQALAGPPADQSSS